MKQAGTDKKKSCCDNGVPVRKKCVLPYKDAKDKIAKQALGHLKTGMRIYTYSAWESTELPLTAQRLTKR
ncbi:hypothetical protein [Chitinophaga parva]|uniref:hypothetical protein n=1 Tax=Chitinophaga parva TaxID=2169414 RepID=UPI00105758CE|nr:hypothetical protein [Chitinophaga parva]